MFSTASLPLSSTGSLNKLVKDYLFSQDKLSEFYSFDPDLQGFKKAIAANPYEHSDRSVLTKTLKWQALRVKNTSEESLQNIDLLSSPNTFTITTGHQLCLFTGPLYFIYKILSAISLAGQLNKQFPANRFIPVYWMASEDHDFEEVNHFVVNRTKLTWSTPQHGPVGRFRTAGLQEISLQLRSLLGKSQTADELITLFDRAYLDHSTLADATRFLVNSLFGEYGLVIVDGDHPDLKKQFIPQIEKDVLSKGFFETVNNTNQKLSGAGYQIQVNPREINCFYMDGQQRLRIERDADQFRLVGTEQGFSHQEIQELIKKEPEKFSPNVVLRPLYQQKILPNLAYVGGPGELAYWLQLKKIHDDEKIFFPVLVPRSFFTVIDGGTKKTLTKLPFTPSDFFLNEDELIKELQIRTQNFFDLSDEEVKIKSTFEEILKKTQAVDRSLDAKVAAELQKTLNAIETIAGKGNKALRRRMEEEIARIVKVKASLFPEKTPQERVVNFSEYYLRYGRAFFQVISSCADPLVKEHVMVLDNS